MVMEIWSVYGKEETREDMTAQFVSMNIKYLDKTPVYRYCENTKKFNTYNEQSITVWF